MTMVIISNDDFNDTTTTHTDSDSDTKILKLQH